MSAGTTNEAAQPVRFRDWTERVLWLVPTVGALLMWWLLPDAPTGFGEVLPWSIVCAMFLLTETQKLRFEYRRQTHSVSLTDVALCTGLFVIPPAGLVLARLVSDVCLLPRSFIRGGQPFTKRLFNLALHALEAFTASAVFLSLGGGPIQEGSSWAAAAAAVTATNLTGAALVVFAIAATQGAIGWSGALNTLSQLVGVGLLTTTLSVIGLLVVEVNPYSAILLSLLLFLLLVGYRAYGRFLRQHGNLGRVYEFSRLVEEAGADRPGLVSALEWLRQHFNATAVHLRLEGGEPPQVSIGLAEGGTTSSGVWERDELHQRLAASRSGLLVSRRDPEDPALHTALVRRDADEVLAVCLRNAKTVFGFLELYDRQGRITFFSADDLRLLENLVSHLTAALENEQLVARLRHDAYHDRLTGLPNRERLTASLDEAIAMAAEGEELVAVLLLDLNSFKDVNDSLGHDHGDHLLVMVGERLRDLATDGAMAARMGADEFAVLCRAPDLATVEARARALHDALAEPYALADLTVHVGVSVGVAVAPEHSQDGSTLLQRADVALYAAKSKDEAVATYLPTLDQASVHRLQLVTQLREALDAGQVTVQYQPKIAMATRELIGVEALVRWEHPQYGPVPPDDFVPLAERTGLIGPLTMHVLRASLLQCRRWLDRDLRIGVAVNLSVRNLLDTDFPDRVADLLAETGTPADLLAFEITESSVMSDPERAMPVLHRLHALGIALSIDDFGTGYSSLAYLRRLPVDEVKIDKVFVLGMGTDLGDLAIVRAIIELGHSLGLRIVAEGVEDELARDLLAGMDCDVAQGFLFSRPLPPDRLDAWLTARTVAHPSQPGVRGRKLQVAG